MTITWKGGHAGAPNSWADPNNWVLGIAPTDNDDVIIAAGLNQPIITANAPAFLNSLTVNPGAILNVGDFTFLAQSVTNAGTISGKNASGDASGVLMPGAGATVTNSGTIAGDVNGTGVVLNEAGLITNSTSGVIKGGINGILSRGAIGTPATVTNSGTIQGTGLAGIGVLFSDSAGVVDNTLTNSGTIIGQTTAVRFGAGNDTLKLLPGFSFSGLVDGGGGTNTLELTAGPGAGRLTGIGTSFTNFATLLVDTSASWTVAGTGSSLGTIAITGLTSTDTIDLTDFAFGKVSWVYANNALVLANGTAQDTLQIQGNFSATDFQVSSDGTGGTAIVAVPAVQPITPANTTPSPLTVFDTTTNQPIAATGEDYTGPVPGIEHEYIINTSPDNLDITASTPNWFIHSGSGDDAIAVSSGSNVVDGGTGSNFLTGGSGTDVFFVDDRSPTANIWSTVVGFHSGDDATIWGITQSDFTLAWLDGQGAATATGLTGGFTANGQPTANITLAGYTTADLGTRLVVTYGKTPDQTGLPGSSYLDIHAT